ncbi:hypothetical protein M0208_14975 [Sphingomonas sp. SUN019]|uniref:energy transducer TonB n=1 Tax=Sphingomonas sp. SUN019 TaxID=2937788 RepID=UPI0021640F9F|nr:hypothetical protein [Sphingomonas sp. SUN019]UVO51747.1 hypothetical protein M0208_14975 [Sphingomonas sp. SUN019]
MKQIVIGLMSGLVTATLLFASTSVNASTDPLQGWVQAANKKIEGRMVYPSNGESGVVVATFQRGQDGRPTAITIRSASPAMARAARLTLNRVRDLAPLPAGYDGKRIRMQMLIGDPTDAADYYAQRKQLLAAAEQNNVQLAAKLQPVQVAATQPR